MKTLILALGLSLAALSMQTQAATYSYGFNNVSYNGFASDMDSPEAAVKMEVADAGSGKVSFTFTNNNLGSDNTAGDTGSIADIYFSNNPKFFSELENDMTVVGSTGVSFDKKASPKDLSDANDTGWEWGVTSDSDSQGVDDQNGRVENGIDNANEWLTITLALVNNHTFQSVIDALNNGVPGTGFTVGLHIISIGDRSVSNSYTTATPIPAAVWLFGSALVGLTGMTRRKKSTTAVVEA
jgi:hypothetical protein